MLKSSSIPQWLNDVVLFSHYANAMQQNSKLMHWS